MFGVQKEGCRDGLVNGGRCGILREESGWGEVVTKVGEDFVLPGIETEIWMERKGVWKAEIRPTIRPKDKMGVRQLYWKKIDSCDTVSMRDGYDDWWQEGD